MIAGLSLTEEKEEQSGTSSSTARKTTQTASHNNVPHTDEAMLKQKEEEQKRQAEKEERIAAYWAEHASEKSAYDTEREQLNQQLAELRRLRDSMDAEAQNAIRKIPLNEDKKKIEENIRSYREELKTLGRFNGKRIKELEKAIDDAAEERAALDAKIRMIKKDIESQYETRKKEIVTQIHQAEARIGQITGELTKDR